jgi:hypothetical protein
VLIAATGPVAERLQMREIDDDEGRRLVRIVHGGSGPVVTWRPAQTVLLSAQGMDVAVIMAEDARRSLAVARELGYPTGEVFALLLLATGAGDLGEALRLARQADQVPGDIPPGMARLRSAMLAGMLIEAGDFAAAEPACAAAVNSARDAGDLRTLPDLLSQMGLLDLRVGRAGDAAAHLREALQLTLRTGAMNWNMLDVCGQLCAATGRPAEAVTAWAAHAALIPRDWFGYARNREEPLRAARQALGPARARAAGQRGAAMSRAAAAEYALLRVLGVVVTGAARLWVGRRRGIMVVCTRSVPRMRSTATGSCLVARPCSSTATGSSVSRRVVTGSPRTSRSLRTPARCCPV